MSVSPDVAGPADLDKGSFSLDPPWLIVPDELVWLRGLDKVRKATRDSVPDLIARRRFPPLARFGISGARLAVALGGWAAIERRKSRSAPVDDATTISRTGLSKRLRKAFEKLGPTYIKLGQIVSSGEGIFPEELVREFRLLRDRVPAEPWEVVRATVEEDLGKPLESVFAFFDRKPMAAASIAQVHAATLITGETVVVKVQRPTVAQLVHLDLAAMAWIAPILVGRIPVAALANPPALVEVFAETIVEELDFRLEAENMLDVARVLAETDQRAIVIPRPHPTLVTKRVLVMERLDGFSFDDVAGMKAAGIDTEAVVRAAMVGFMEGAMLFGVFHGDLHGGNLYVMPDNKVALLDFGITGRLDEPRRLAFLRLLIGGTANDPTFQMEALRDLGALPADTDIAAVIRDLGFDQPVQDPTQMTADELTNQLKDITKALLGYGAKLPKELMLFVKDMLFLDGALATLAPDIDLFAEITEIATYFATRHGDRIAKDVGFELEIDKIDLEGMKASMGLTDDVEKLTYRDLQERRNIIQKRMEDHGKAQRADRIEQAKQRFRFKR